MRLSNSGTSTLAAIALTLLAAPLQAQGADLAQLNWDLGTASPSYCVHFLMDPKEAAKELTGDLKAVAANSVSDLHPALKRAITDEPKFSEWVPSELCVYYVSTITYDLKRYERGDKNSPLALFYWGIAASQGEAAWDGRFRLRTMGANNYGLVRATQVKGLQMEKSSIDVDSVAGQEDRVYYLKLNGATIQFNGHFNPDTTGAPATERTMVGITPGPLQSVWITNFNYTPAAIGTMAGSLQIFGSRGLAKALNSSPIRLIGPAVTGGSGRLSFVRKPINKR